MTIVSEKFECTLCGWTGVTADLAIAEGALTCPSCYGQPENLPELEQTGETHESK